MTRTRPRTGAYAVFLRRLGGKGWGEEGETFVFSGEVEVWEALAKVAEGGLDGGVGVVRAQVAGQQENAGVLAGHEGGVFDGTVAEHLIGDSQEMGVVESQLATVESSFLFGARVGSGFVVAQIGDLGTTRNLHFVAEGVQIAAAGPFAAVVVQRKRLDLPAKQILGLTIGKGPKLEVLDGALGEHFEGHKGWMAKAVLDGEQSLLRATHSDGQAVVAPPKPLGVFEALPMVHMGMADEHDDVAYGGKASASKQPRRQRGEAAPCVKRKKDVALRQGITGGEVADPRPSGNKVSGTATTENIEENSLVWQDNRRLRRT